MIPKDFVEQAIGHSPGGVCPFAIKPNVDVYLDESLRDFDWIYPAAGDSQSAVELTPNELEKYSSAKDWVDVAKD
ncbi:tRNA proofreading protein [Tetragenococcus muriaticus 3MR10-3]|uniref:tRNA proofreading protein n=2 Tax=Tetragenococcus muriaticus TaxID=64642 RepID=A0A091C4H0_9ENTE|nr:tRNA proofreading protein [Tetragenococcus muriaticus 3MR10-3]